MVLKLYQFKAQLDFQQKTLINSLLIKRVQEEVNRSVFLTDNR